jgi:hypothetical protein
VSSGRPQNTMPTIPTVAPRPRPPVRPSKAHFPRRIASLPLSGDSGPLVLLTHTHMHHTPRRFRTPLHPPAPTCTHRPPHLPRSSEPRHSSIPETFGGLEPARLARRHAVCWLTGLPPRVHAPGECPPHPLPSFWRWFSGRWISGEDSHAGNCVRVDSKSGRNSDT